MRLEGRLNLKHNNDDYLIFSNGRTINLSDILYAMYTEKAKVRVKIIHRYDNKILFDETGELTKEKIAPKYYVYHIDDKDFDSILWDNVGSLLIIEIKNVSKN